jgi:Putative 2/3 transmembrane domain holin
MSCWLLVSGLLFSAVAYAAPHTVPVLANKLLLVTLASYLGYLISVSTFPYARPGHLLYLIDHLNAEAAPPNEWELLMGRLAVAAMIARALIMGAAIIGISLGL